MARAVAASGHVGQLVEVVPDLHLVVVRAVDLEVDPDALGSTTTTAVPAIAGTKPKASVKGKEVSKRSTGRVAAGPRGGRA